jgi:uncharacterized integral membrane protein
MGLLAAAAAVVVGIMIMVSANELTLLIGRRKYRKMCRATKKKL